MPTGMNIFSIIVFIFYIIIFLAGLVNAIAPRWCWKTFQSWKATGEPSDTYFFVQRVSGIVVMVVITTIAVLPTLLAYLDR